ncbi:hypothetical protein [Actinocorallia populi]|uniref:hypothetical protein n=1 Tax=Actinocorallia populi TaxID=2079200 RepID=UPI000D09339A|nr:hypothetical protein [Actinocorallia populi]
MIKSTGAVLCLVLALAGCGEGTTIPNARTPRPDFTGPLGTAAEPTRTVTVAAGTVTVNPPVRQDVRVGSGCTVEGEVGRTMAGRMARCVKRTGEDSARWVLDAGSQPDGTVKPGRACPAQGARGTDGYRPYECLPGSGGALVWKSR